MLLHVDGFVDIVSWACKAADTDSFVPSLLPKGPGLPLSLGIAMGGLAPRENLWKRGAMFCTHTSLESDRRENWWENWEKNEIRDVKWRKEKLAMEYRWDEAAGLRDQDRKHSRRQWKKRMYRCPSAGNMAVKGWSLFEGHFFSFFPRVAQYWSPVISHTPFL